MSRLMSVRCGPRSPTCRQRTSMNSPAAWKPISPSWPETAGETSHTGSARPSGMPRSSAALPGCRCGWPGRGLRPQSLREYALAFVAVVVVVQLGRGWLRRTAAPHPVLVVANVAAVIVAVTAWGSGAGTYCEADAYSPTPGVSLEALRSTTSSSMTPAASA